MILIDIFAIGLSIVAIIISVVSWRKSRAIYKVERKTIRQFTGKHDDLEISEDTLNEKLKNGEWAILHILERTKSDGDWEVLLGRIKK